MRYGWMMRRVLSTAGWCFDMAAPAEPVPPRKQRMRAPEVFDEASTVSPHEVSDGELARRVQDGDSDAFEELARKYIRSVYAVVSSFLRGQEDIDDSVQETFLRALEKIQSFNPKRPFAPWLYQVARNVARNRWKYLKSRQHEDLSEFERVPAEADGENPGTLAELSELRSNVAAAIDSLPERQRTAFRLHDIDGFKATEIAEMLDVTAGTVRSNVHHARKELRKRLERYRLDWDDS
jgi:RNA polymerase sigma-70 factor (ECF subfamily)